MQEQDATKEYLSLADVAKIALGRPTTNCIWRWCRRGVLSRSGERVRLQHVRMGGMIYTTRAWLEEFGRLLAEADAQYFDLAEAAISKTRTSRRKRTPHRSDQTRRQAIEDAERELDKAGI